MTAMRRLLLAAALLVAVAPARGQEGEGSAPPAAGAIAFRPVVERVVDAMIVPAYERLAATAGDEKAAAEALCAAPDAARLAAARAGFRDLVVAWSAVEMFRFGPARQANRFERLFFWPDPRGRGLQQVQEVIATTDPTATGLDTLRAKSVAVQGLLALEYVLFGTGSEALVQSADPAAAFRCAYAATIAAAIAATADEIVADWTKAGGYADLMRNAGPDDAVYRSHGEVAQELIKAAREQLQLVRDLKLGAAIGATPEKAQPKRAPFWRSNLVLPAVGANLEAIIALVGANGIGAALPRDKAWVAGQVAFELGRADEVLDRVAASGTPWEVLAAEPAANADIRYTLIPLGDVLGLLETDYPDALGLITGFNSLDGD
jgi:predicted lipoprotein